MTHRQNLPQLYPWAAWVEQPRWTHGDPWTQLSFAAPESTATADAGYLAAAEVAGAEILLAAEAEHLAADPGQPVVAEAILAGA